MKEFVIISDMHCGSKYSISTQPRTSTQKTIKKQWDKMIDTLSSYTLTGGINLGDSTEGTDYHGQGKDNDSNDKLWQINMAKELLDEIPTKKWHVVNGSGYHVGKNLSDDELLADKMGAEFGNELAIDTGLGRIHCAHKVGVSMSATAYRPTAIAREMMLATINQEEYGKFKSIIRGHAHYFCMVRFGGGLGLIAPCWKGRDSFAQERTMAMMPHLGFCVLQFDNDEVILKQHVFTLKGGDLIKEVKV